MNAFRDVLCGATVLLALVAGTAGAASKETASADKPLRAELRKQPRDVAKSQAPARTASAPGKARRYGGDDDLKDLEVERVRGRARLRP